MDLETDAGIQGNISPFIDPEIRCQKKTKAIETSLQTLGGEQFMTWMESGPKI